MRKIILFLVMFQCALTANAQKNSEVLIYSGQNSLAGVKLFAEMISENQISLRGSDGWGGVKLTVTYNVKTNKIINIHGHNGIGGVNINCDYDEKDNTVRVYGSDGVGIVHIQVNSTDYFSPLPLVVEAPIQLEKIISILKTKK